MAYSWRMRCPTEYYPGHDRYGRLLKRIEVACGKQRYSGKSNEIVDRNFHSWPELFLYGDVYIVGLNLSESEFDLWWLLRRKQRERYADGKVFFTRDLQYLVLVRLDIFCFRHMEFNFAMLGALRNKITIYSTKKLYMKYVTKYPVLELVRRKLLLDF